MKKEHKNWYFTSPDAISRYLFSIINNWGYSAKWNKSSDSESRYLKINIGSFLCPKALHIRISNHSVPPASKSIKFDFDVYCSHDRKGAISYVNLLGKLANELNRPMPLSLNKIKAGTRPYKYYRIEMQNRAKNKRRFYAGDRLYV